MTEIPAEILDWLRSSGDYYLSYDPISGVLQERLSVHLQYDQIINSSPLEELRTGLENRASKAYKVISPREFEDPATRDGKFYAALDLLDSMLPYLTTMQPVPQEMIEGIEMVVREFKPKSDVSKDNTDASSR